MQARPEPFLCLIACCCAAAAVRADERLGGGRTLRVPEQHLTIQAAIDAANDGDTVLVSPGVYREGIRLSGKSVTLASEYLVSGDEALVRKTVLDGALAASDGRARVRDQIILVEADAGPATQIVGFTICNGDDGIACHAKVRIAHSYFTRNDDAIDYEGGGGVCEFNTFERNTDDAVDLDLDCAVVVANNVIRDNDDDGIEIRLHDYRGETLRIVIRDNVITGNGEDGIQIIDYPGLSDRRIRIERNLIAGNTMAGIGCMADGITKENYQAADIPEPIEIVNNTIADNEYGITGGGQVVAFNNVLANNRMLGLKKVGQKSIVAHNLFWKNGVDHADSNVQSGGSQFADPHLGEDYRPSANSPIVDAGVARLAGPLGLIELMPSNYSGAAPELGAFEFDEAAAE